MASNLRTLLPTLLGRPGWQSQAGNLLLLRSTSSSSSSSRARLDGRRPAALARWSSPIIATASAPFVAPSLPDPTPSEDASALAAGWVDSTAAAANLADSTVDGAESIGSVAAHLLLDHPWPFLSPLPPYMTTIVLATIFLRLAVTLPVTLWARRREIRLKEIALPELTTFRNEAREGLVDGCRREGYSHDQYNALLKDRCKEANKAIIDKHACAPLPTILVPLLTQFPIFIGLVYILRAASTSVTSPLAHELLPLLETPLLEPDTTGVLPIAVGLLMWSNTELLARGRTNKDELYPFESSAAREPLSESVELPDGKGGYVMTEVETRAGWLDRWKGNILKGFGITFTAISIFAPSCMQVYFITTYAFTLAQTVLINRADSARLLALRAKLAANPPVAYGVRTAGLPKTMTAVPPLPAGSTKQKFDRPPKPREALKIEPIKLTFDVETGINYPIVGKIARKLALERAAEDDAVKLKQAEELAIRRRRRGHSS